MITVRKSTDRGRFNHGWLDTQHTFSFASYRDPEFMGFRSLRVMNEDKVAPGQGFGTHGHRDMEIISYVLDGALEHKDSMGNGSVIRRGMFQRMTAGSGVQHSEFNHSKDEPLHFYQIWILPERGGIEPGYEELAVPAARDERVQLVASHDGRDGSMTIHQDASLYLIRLEAGESLGRALADSRYGWVQVVSGDVQVNDTALSTGDGASIEDESSLSFVADTPSEILLFDLA